MITETDLLRLRRGDMTFESFASKTRPDFLRLARKLSLSLPPWMDMEDLAHEMLMSVPVALEQWREGDYRLKGFVVFRACAHARKVASRARGKSANEVSVEENDGAAYSVAAAPSTQHERVEMAERLASIERELPQTPMQRAVLHSLARTQSMDATARELILHPDTRVMFAADADLVRSKIRRVMTVLAARAR